MFNAQDKLTDIDKESDQLGKKHEVLELHNEVLLMSELVDTALVLKYKQRIVRYSEASIERLLITCEADLREKLIDMERSIALLNQTE